MEVSISDLLNEGKKSLSDEKYDDAIMQFRKIEELLNEGQLKDAKELEIAEFYLLYGKALMEKNTTMSIEDAENVEYIKHLYDKMYVDSEESEEEIELQQACQYLNLAKEKYLKKADSSKDAALKLSEIYSLFAEFEYERNCDNSIINVISSIAVLKKHLRYDDWKLLMHYHQLGYLYKSVGKYTDAIRAYQKFKKDLIRKLRVMKNRTKRANNDGRKEEIRQMKLLLVDVKQKIKEAKRYASHEPVEVEEQEEEEDITFSQRFNAMCG